MKILVLYGPNLNLLGWISRAAGSRLTLDKLNRALRRKARELDVELKILQRQSESDTTRLLQRQRNKVSGVLLVPGLWAETGRLLQETIAITGLPLAVFYLEPESGPWHNHKVSIFRDMAVLEARGAHPEAFDALLEQFAEHLRP